MNNSSVPSFYEQLHALAMSYYSLPLFPVLYVVHSVIAGLHVRAQLGGVQFAMEHPLASFVGHFVVASAGGMSAALLLGNKSILMSVTLPNIIVSIIVWYLVFFSPLDVFYYLASTLPVKLLLSMLNEVRRSLNIMAGVVAACAVFPPSLSYLLAISIIGTLKGSGSKWGITVYQWIARLPDGAGKHELLQVSLVTKASFVCAIVYTLNELKVITFHREDLCLLTGILLISLKLYCVLIAEVDPFLYPANTLWSLCTCVSPTRSNHHHHHSFADHSSNDGTSHKLKTS
ncbi:trimeric intracellular cation channel type 1B.2-like isoform X1 [Dysidea avara]|uniref:trimeric intracellular cation channel type 1B.2-like isoform X1 n=1 Tax=Dysidea avara TaxID=196820 RepID=UPI0033299521